VESVGVAVVAVIIAILILVGISTRVTAGILIGIGGQTIALFASYIGFYSQQSGEFNNYQVKYGGWLGILGAGCIVAAGIVAATMLSGRPGRAAGQPAGWYPDPADHGRRRYWSGTAWTEHTQGGPSPEGAS
jgi:Protein of unknown function (DUF2510)